MSYVLLGGVVLGSVDGAWQRTLAVPKPRVEFYHVGDFVKIRDFLCYASRDELSDVQSGNFIS